MSYRCQFCGDHVGHGIPLRRRIVYRTNGQIERESPICPGCEDGIPKKVKPGNGKVWQPQLVPHVLKTMMEVEMAIPTFIPVPLHEKPRPAPTGPIKLGGQRIGKMSNNGLSGKLRNDKK